MPWINRTTTANTATNDQSKTQEVNSGLPKKTNDPGKKEEEIPGEKPHKIVGNDHQKNPSDKVANQTKTTPRENSNNTTHDSSNKT